MPKSPRDPAYSIGTGHWADYEEPVYVAGPTEGMVRFGCQPGWSPAREAQKEIGCRTCGGVVAFDRDDPGAALPIDLPRHGGDLSWVVLVVPDDDALDGGLCISCMRWAKDNWLARVMDREYANRGSNAPIAVKIHEGGTVPLPA